MSHSSTSSSLDLTCRCIEYIPMYDPRPSPPQPPPSPPPRVLKKTTAKAIRKKYLALKLERNENDIAINKALAPLTTPLKKIAENTSPTPKKRQKIYAESSPSPSSTLNVKSKAESIDTVKEEEKEEKEEEINKSVSFSNQQPQPQQSSDDENNYDDAIGFDKSIDQAWPTVFVPGPDWKENFFAGPDKILKLKIIKYKIDSFK
ncbi:hypothetical protein ABEB36_000209 [Hypothenemus hampei]|uniref:Uncharacterized protein n=1 Tax=Hypothenemus hampei TaxID=57062 RepID=A0ABD1FBA3_HYPHA